jgi:hypothetical protein
MTKLLKYIKSLKTIYVPSLWFGVLLVALFFPQYVLWFMFGTAWGVLWMIGGLCLELLGEYCG